MSDSEEDASLERQVKISLVGEPSTGKSMLCSRYLGFQWSGAGVPTQGAEILLGECPVRPAYPPVSIKMCDIAGSSCNTSMLVNYLYASDIIILVYDVTNLQSFERLGIWLNNIKNIFIDCDTQPVLAMFGNKCDLEHQRAVRLGCTQSFSEDNSLISFTGSARTGENINSSIIILVSHVLGIPVNRSLFNNSVIKAELAPHRKNDNLERKKSLHPVLTTQTSNNNNNNNHKKIVDDERNTQSETITKRKSNKKILKDLRKKGSSAVLIEKYTENVRFCIICNYLGKITPAIQSRCTRFRFAPLQSSQIIPRVKEIIEKEDLDVTDDGLKALLALSGGDMRKILNTLQSTWLAYKKVTENNVYTCVGHPLRNDIENIMEWLLNEDEFAVCYDKIKTLKNAKGLALSDILTEVHTFIHRTELPANILIMLLTKMCDLEQRLSVGCNENIQLVSLISYFMDARSLIKV